MAWYQTQHVTLGHLKTKRLSLQKPYITPLSMSRPHLFVRGKPHQVEAGRPAAICLWLCLGATPQQWPHGHGKKAGGIPATIAHNNYRGAKSPKSAVCMTENPEIWQASGCEVSNMQLRPTSTLPIRSAPCVVSCWALIKAMYIWDKVGHPTLCVCVCGCTNLFANTIVMSLTAYWDYPLAKYCLLNLWASCNLEFYNCAPWPTHTHTHTDFLQRYFLL